MGWCRSAARSGRRSWGRPSAPPACPPSASRGAGPTACWPSRRRPLPEVVVVGGGPAGTAAAVFLRQAGHDVVLLDEARFPRDKVCGEGVSPEAWRLLDRMGAGRAVRALRPHPLRGMTLWSPSGIAFTGHYDAAREPGFAERRWCLDRALLDCARAAGVEVREGVRVQGLVRREGALAGVVTD